MLWKTLSFSLLTIRLLTLSLILKQKIVNCIIFFECSIGWFEFEIFVPFKNSWECFHKIHLIAELFLKFSKHLNVSSVFTFFHKGMNVPTDRILIVARFGLKLFDRLCSSTGTIWFSNILRGQIEISKGSILTRGRFEGSTILVLFTD